MSASLTEAQPGKALSDRPALEPYWGKPAERRHHRSPVRAIVLPDRCEGDDHGEAYTAIVWALSGFRTVVDRSPTTPLRREASIPASGQLRAKSASSASSGSSPSRRRRGPHRAVQPECRPRGEFAHGAKRHQREGIDRCSQRVRPGSERHVPTPALHRILGRPSTVRGSPKSHATEARRAPIPSHPEACAEARRRDERSDDRARPRRAGRPSQTSSRPVPDGPSAPDERHRDSKRRRS